MSLQYYPIETGRLVLRRFTLDDAPAMHAYVSLPEVARYMMWEPLSLEETRARLERWLGSEGDAEEGDNLSFAITLKGSGELVGDCGLGFRNKAARQAEIGFSLNPAHQGKGYATEAVGEMLRLGFERCNRHRIYARCDARNDGSWRLMERLGMRREAHFREHALFKGGWDDEFYYAMLEDEWRAQQEGAA